MCVENKLFPHGFNTEVFNLTGFLLDSFFRAGGVADCNSTVFNMSEL